MLYKNLSLYIYIYNITNIYFNSLLSRTYVGYVVTTCTFYMREKDKMFTCVNKYYYSFIKKKNYYSTDGGRIVIINNYSIYISLLSFKAVIFCICI